MVETNRKTLFFILRARKPKKVRLAASEGDTGGQLGQPRLGWAEGGRAHPRLRFREGVQRGAEPVPDAVGQAFEGHLIARLSLRGEGGTRERGGE
jgi:hypothetical protein